MSSTDLAPYTVLLDGTAHTITLPAYYQAHGLIVVNNGAVELTVSSARGESWTVAPGGRLEAPQPTPAPSYTFTSERADPAGGTASAQFTQALIPVLSESTPTTSTVPVADIVLLASQSLGPNLAQLFTFTVPPDIQSVSVVFQATNGLGNSVLLVGQQSQANYIHTSINASPAADQLIYSAAIFPGLDTTLNLTVSTGIFAVGQHAIFSVVGHRDLIGPPVSQRGTPYVTIDTAAGAVPVALSGTQPALTVHGVPAVAPAYSAQGLVSAPALNAVIVSVTVVAAGTYRIVATAGSAETAGATKGHYLVIGGTVYGFAAVPGGFTWDIPAIALAANTVVVIQNAAAGTDTHSGSVFAYAL